MAQALATFVLVVAVVFAVYWAGVVRPEQAAERALKKRLRAGAAKPALRPEAFVKKAERLSDVPAVEAALKRAAGASGRLQRRLAQAGADVTVGTLVLSAVCLFLVGWLVVRHLTGLSWVSLLAGLLAGYLPFAWIGWRRRSRLLLFEEQFPEAIDLISRALRAGHAFTTGLAMVAEEAPKPVSEEFRLLYDQQNFGRPLPDALRDFANRVPLIDARFFATAVLTQRESGGNLAEILDNMAGVIRERFKVRRQVRAVTAHARITGWVLVCLPPVTALGYLIVSPGHLNVLLTDPLGGQMIAGAIVLQSVGTLVIRRLVDIEY